MSLSTCLSTCLSSGSLASVTLNGPRITSKGRASMASYPAAWGTATTKTGNFLATNPNQPIADIQRVGMMFTSEMVQKNGGVGWTYLMVRGNYCRPQLYKPNTGDDGLNKAVSAYCDTKWKKMGCECSMFDAVARTLHLEVPIRGDAGLIFHRDRFGNLRLLEFSADMLGEPLFFVNPKHCSLKRGEYGEIHETAGRDCVYYAGRYFAGPDCVAYKIFQRNAAGFWSNPVIYSADDVIYCVDPFNFRSFRGVTKFAQVLRYMQTGEDMLHAALASAQTQARRMGRVYNNSGGPNGSEIVYQGEQAYSPGVQTIFQITPNAPVEEYRFVGDEAELLAAAAPGSNIIDGKRAADEATCNGLGMTYGFVVAYDQLGGAPSRLDVGRNTKEIERIENDISRPCLDRIKNETIRDGIRKGELPPEPRIYDGNWMFTTLPTADAYKDSMEDIKAVRAGQDSDSRVVARYNVTYPEIMQDKEDETVAKYTALANAKKRLLKAGINEVPTIADIAQISDNPQQAQTAQDLAQGKPTTITDTNSKPNLEDHKTA